MRALTAPLKRWRALWSVLLKRPIEEMKNTHLYRPPAPPSTGWIHRPASPGAQIKADGAFGKSAVFPLSCKITKGFTLNLCRLVTNRTHRRGKRKSNICMCGKTKSKTSACCAHLIFVVLRSRLNSQNNCGSCCRAACRCLAMGGGK